MTATNNQSVAMQTALATARNTTIGANATITVMAGTIPASPAASVAGNQVLAVFHGSLSAFGTVSGPTLTLNALQDGSNQVNASNTNTATFARVANSTGAAMHDVGVGVSGESLTINTTSVVAGGPLQLALNGTFTESA